ncbi:hypothetical protein NQ317_013619 [Molorchus minor]|uniref:Uncharacterized protein n=1 Tax=Molorchus minor TaxID=1323400 RepID=A0ABQ9JE58_9CUCU|nr:hypothetical protein NQ317_013619 [Molorchus minor]
MGSAATNEMVNDGVFDHDRDGTLKFVGDMFNGNLGFAVVVCPEYQIYLLIKMSNEHKIGKITCERLGIKDNLIIKKAEEFLRLFQSKGSVVKSLNETAKIILCLDLAATSVGSSFDQETAVKLSGLKKSSVPEQLTYYRKNKPLTVSELCVQFGDTYVKDLAEEILKKYMSNNVKAKDVGHPQYIAAAVFIQPADNQIEVGEIPKENEIEPYEVWKKRILYEAYAVLQKEENMQE